MHCYVLGQPLVWQVHTQVHTHVHSHTHRQTLTQRNGHCASVCLRQRGTQQGCVCERERDIEERGWIWEQFSADMNGCAWPLRPQAKTSQNTHISVKCLGWVCSRFLPLQDYSLSVFWHTHQPKQSFHDLSKPHAHSMCSQSLWIVSLI